jgi:protein-disulfide isomerase
VAALAAGQQQKFWNYTELFYNQQGAEGTGYVTGAYLDGLARQIPGLNVSTWSTARGNPTLAAQVQSDQAQAAAQGFNSTPTLIFQGPKGKLQPPDAVPPYAELQAAIKQVA